MLVSTGSKMNILVLDIGGTGSRALFSTSGENGEVESKVAEGPGANPNRVGKETTSETIAALVRKVGLGGEPCDRLVVGLAGISCIDSFEAVRNGVAQSGLQVKKENAWLMSDAELAHIAAFGYDVSNGDGILLIAGTGSIALARPGATEASQGSIIRAGGHGYKEGDEGSGFWLGSKLKELQETSSEVRKSLIVRLGMTEEEVSNAEPSTLSVATDDLSVSHVSVLQIAQDGGMHLAKLCFELKQKNGALRRVKAWGSVLKNSATVRKYFTAALSESGLIDDGDVADVLTTCTAPLLALGAFPEEGLFLL